MFSQFKKQKAGFLVTHYSVH